MPKNNELINLGSKTSTALVAPTRSEIRISFCMECSLFVSVRKVLHRAAFVLTPVLCAALAVCFWLGVVLPAWAVATMVIPASIGFLYGCFHILSEADVFEEQRLKGGKA